MIKLRDSAILVLGSDGRAEPFEQEDLQARIIRSCLDCGEKDVWIAQDISLSVEFAIVSQAKDGDATVRAAELDALVVKILDETGYPEVAESFRVSAPKEETLVDYGSKAALAELLAKRAGLSGKALAEVAESVGEALRKLGIEKASPQLALELARHYKDASASGTQTLKEPAVLSVKQGLSQFLAEAQDIVAELPPEQARLVERGILSPRPLSRLFPALRLDLKLGPFAESLGLERPASEMAIAAKLGILAKGVDALCEAAQKLCAKAGRKDCLPLPLWLRFADLESFSVEWLGFEPGSFHGLNSELAAQLLQALARQPFKVTQG